MAQPDAKALAVKIFRLASGDVAIREVELLAQSFCSTARYFANTTTSPEFEYRRLLRDALDQLEPRPGFVNGRRREVLNRARSILSDALRQTPN